MFRLRIYEVKTEYVEYLSKYQDHLFMINTILIRENT